MGLKQLTISALAAVIAVSGIGSILVAQHQPANVHAVELSGDGEPAIRREDDDDAALEAVEDDDARGDGDRTAGDDGTSGGANTGDGDRTAGDDGTSGGANTADNTASGGGTGSGDTTD